MKLKLLRNVLGAVVLAIVLLIGGIQLSSYLFNHVNPWFGIVSTICWVAGFIFLVFYLFTIIFKNHEKDTNFGRASGDDV